jgi:hypothetical protein
MLYPNHSLAAASALFYHSFDHRWQYYIASSTFIVTAKMIAPGFYYFCQDNNESLWRFGCRQNKRDH